MRIAVLALAVTILAAAAPALAAERAPAQGRPAPEPGGGTFPLARATPETFRPAPSSRKKIIRAQSSRR